MPGRLDVKAKPLLLLIMAITYIVGAMVVMLVPPALNIGLKHDWVHAGGLIFDIGLVFILGFGLTQRAIKSVPIYYAGLYICAMSPMFLTITDVPPLLKAIPWWVAAGVPCLGLILLVVGTRKLKPAKSSSGQAGLATEESGPLVQGGAH